MIKIQKLLLWSISLFLLWSINLHAQNTMGFVNSLLGTIRAPAPDTSGFIDTLTCANAVNGHVVWQESPFSGEWYNFAFTDNFSFTYKFYGSSAPPPSEDIATVSAFDAAMGDFRTSYCGPRFSLLGYVVEDSLWCIITSSLSPEYFECLNPEENPNYEINEIWYEWRDFWDSPPPQYLYEETYVNHNLNIWGRIIPNKTVQVWWGADAFACWESYRTYDLIQARDICVNSPLQSEPGTWYDSLDEYMDSGSGVWTFLGEFNAGDTSPPPGEEPPGWAKGTFEKRINRDLSNADNWLPEPGAEIGLRFKFERTEVPATITVGYNVFFISTWQGECMNYPADAPRPKPLGTNAYFDFVIVDTAKYHIETYDYDVSGYYDRDSGDIVSIRRYAVSANLNFPADSTEIHDVLWLKALDYGAKALVGSYTGQTWRDLTQMDTTAFGQHVWAVSVPRDDDGQAVTGYNYGDFMADAWEETILGLSSKSRDSSVVSFTPFYTLNTTGLIDYTDKDNYPTGRNIKGDGFCNWEEYRGFVTVGDQYGFYPSSNPYQHKRLNPSKKEVMVHFMPNVECMNEAPGLMSALPDTMAYLVKHLTNLEDTDSLRKDFNRNVNANKYGAWYPYYSRLASFGSPNDFNTTNKPAEEDNQNAVVFWPRYSRMSDSTLINNIDLGYTYGKRAFEYGALIPNLTKGIVVNKQTITNALNGLDYYDTHPDSLNTDLDRLTRITIAHELGHSIAISHDSAFDYIMQESLRIAVDEQGHYRFVLVYPGFNSYYSVQSENKISIQRK